MKNTVGFVIFPVISVFRIQVNGHRNPSHKTTTYMRSLASIDLGTHTARLLIAQPSGQGTRISPLLRKRTTIRLAQGIGTKECFEIPEEAQERTIEAVSEFADTVRGLRGELIGAVCTGVVRLAANRKHFLKRLRQRTGVSARIISGEEEAELTAKGVLSALGRVQRPFVIFDLGGGTTELVFGSQKGEEAHEVVSLPLGALVLKERYLRSDPPGEDEIRALSKKIDTALSEGLNSVGPSRGVCRIIGTGGTVTTLGAMIRGIVVSRISPELMNGLALEKKKLEDLFKKIISVPLDQRIRFKGLDRGRADVIPAGTLVVLRLLRYFKAPEVTVCLSDILEGVLISYLEGVPNEQR